VSLKFITLLLTLFIFNPVLNESKKVDIRVKKIDTSKKQLVQKNIIIGDSQSPFVDWGSQSFNLISSKGGQSSLWLGGKTLGWLLESIKVYPGDSLVTGVAL